MLQDLKVQIFFYTAGSVLVILAVVGLVELILPGLLPRSATNQLSKILNGYLEWKFPIRSHDGQHSLPACPYRWPNGQGDSGKFLDGIENSARWEKEYGAIYRIWSGMNPEVVLTHPRQLQAVFRDSDSHLKAHANNSGHYMNELLGKCVGLISGQEWRNVRAVVQVPFSHQAVSQLIPKVERHIKEHFQTLHAHGNLDQGLVHPARDMKMLPFWVVCEVYYGRLPPELYQELVELAPLREQVFQYVIQGGLPRFSWSRWLPTTANAQLKEFKQRWRDFNRRAAEHARLGSAKAPILAMHEAVLSRLLSEEQLLQTLDESLFANLDVTTGGLSWNLVFLAAHPSEQARLRREVEEAQRHGLLDTLVLSRDTFLAACVLESSRLKPLAAFSVPQAAPTARTVDGYSIPAGTSFTVDAYALNVRNEAWAPDNTTYRPDRFLGQRDGDRRYLFWRFGFGPRQCMGKYVADLVIRMTMAHLVTSYDLSLVDDVAWKRSRESWITHPDMQLRCVSRV